MKQLAAVGKDNLADAIEVWAKYYDERGEWVYTTFLKPGERYVNGDGVDVYSLVKFARVTGSNVETGEVEIGRHPDGSYRAGKCVHYTLTPRGVSSD